MANPRDTTTADLLAFLGRLRAEASRRLSVRPQDAHDNEYPQFDRECSRADRAYQQHREEE